MNNKKKIPVVFISNLVYQKSLTSLMNEEEEKDSLSVQDALEVLRESGVEMDEKTLLQEYEKEERKQEKNKVHPGKKNVQGKKAVGKMSNEFRIFVAIAATIVAVVFIVLFSNNPQYEPLRKMVITEQVKKEEGQTDFAREFVKIAFSYTPKNFDYQLDAVLSYSNEKCKEQVFQYLASDPALRNYEWAVLSINAAPTKDRRGPYDVRVSFIQRIVSAQGGYEEKPVELVLKIQKANKTPFNRFGMKVQEIQWIHEENK